MTTLTATNGAPPAPTLTDLARLRRRIQHGFAVLETLHDDARFQAAILKLDGLRGDYYNGIIDFKTTMPRAEVRSQRDRWHERLCTGWERPATEAVLAKFDEVLSEYLVLGDAELGAQIVTVHLDAQLRLIRAGRETGVTA